ncbi:MAG: 3-phosphoshikimate 1-carboxyvinyltransferase, partial [Oscillospiraceae bacterium]
SPLQSKAYVDMTIQTLKQFGVEIAETNNSYKIKGGQKYVSPKEVFAEGDWSNGAFFICGGVLSGSLKIKGLSFSSTQGDKEIYNILKNMGADLREENGYIYAEKSVLSSASVDVSQIPDLVPILAVTMAYAKGKSVIYNAARLRIKESDRLKSTTEGILNIGGDIAEKEDSLEINGKEKLTGGEINSFNDHRIAMAMAIASLECEKPVIINDPMCVKKSYPNFYEDFEKAGGIKNVINMGK